MKELYHEWFVACSPKVLEQVMFKRILNGNIHGRLYGLMIFFCNSVFRRVSLYVLLG